MLDIVPSKSVLVELLGQSLFGIWQDLCSVIDNKYETEGVWNTGGKNWKYEYKYRKGGKRYVLCMQGRNVSASWSYSEKRKERSLMISETLFQMLYANGMMKQQFIVTGNGSCLNRPTHLSLMIILSCWLSRESRIGNNNSDVYETT